MVAERSEPVSTATRSLTDVPRPWTLEDLRPHVVNLTRGEFSNDGIMQTSQADVDAIFDVHLPAWLARAERPGPLVIWAHGGIVSEKSGLTIAANQIPWWLANGAYPLHFVWETGFVETLRQLLGWRSRRDQVGDRRQFGDLDRAAEVQEGRFGSQLWTAVKRNAAMASGPGGGARYVGARLARFCAENPDRVTVHAAGHSAGAIFQSHFIPTARDQGAPRFDSLQLLAPALRVDGFRTQLLPLVGRDIDKMTLFTMNMRAEEDDNCLQLYRRSLLYLVSRVFEPEDEAPILGLEQSIRDDSELVAAFGLQPGIPGRAQVIWSPTSVDAAPDSRSSAISHGGFDNDPDTMNSVARRILGHTRIQEFPVGARMGR
jgi:hypothetical protein